MAFSKRSGWTRRTAYRSKFKFCSEFEFSALFTMVFTLKTHRELTENFPYLELRSTQCVPKNFCRSRPKRLVNANR